MFCFERAQAASSVFKRLVAFATRGRHCHVECVFCEYVPGKSVFALEPHSFTAAMSASFSVYPVYTDYYRTGEWDYVFVPLDTEQLVRAKQWATDALGKPYDYTHAFSCPFTCMHSPTLVDGVSAHEKASLFCSEACLYILHAAGVLGTETRRIVPERCSPSALFSLLLAEQPGSVHVDELRIVLKA
jgi:hypothetical protein